MSAVGDVLQGIVGLLAMVAAVGALVRLRATPSGLCVGIGLGLLGLVSTMTPVQRLVSQAMAEQEGTLDELAQVRTLFDSCSHTVSGLLWLLIAVGLALLPRSLAHLRQWNRDQPTAR